MFGSANKKIQQKSDTIQRDLCGSSHHFDHQFDYFRAFSRNRGILDLEESIILRATRVAIPGCGGVGGIHALTLARLGIGNFVLADFDCYEVENFNRQFGARLSTVGKSKVEVIANDILEINPEAKIEIFSEAITDTNIYRFLNHADIVIDAIDFFAFQAKHTLFTTAQDLGIPIITGGPLGYSCALLIFTKDSMSYSDYFDIRQSDSTLEKSIKFGIGVAPRATQFSYVDRNSVDLDNQKGPSTSIGVTMCASMVAAQVVKLALDHPSVKVAPFYHQFDPFRLKFVKGKLRHGNRGVIQRIKFSVGKRVYGKRLLSQLTPSETEVKTAATPEKLDRLPRSILSTENLQDMISLATRSPILNDVQPFHFQWDGQNLDIYFDHRGLSNIEDRVPVEAIVSLGALIEAIRVAAGIWNFMIEPSIDYSSLGGVEVWASIQFERGDVQVDQIQAGLSKRKSHHGVFRQGNIHDRHFKRMLEDSQQFDLCHLHLTEPVDQAVIDYLLVNSSDSVKSETDFQAKMGKSRAKSESKGFRRIWASDSQKQALTREKMLSSTYWGLVTARGKCVDELVESGRLVMRAWLHLNQAGYGFQALLSPLRIYEGFCHSQNLDSSPAVDRRHKVVAITNRRSAERKVFHRAFLTETEDIPVLMFRTGLSRPPSACKRRPNDAERRNIEDILVCREGNKICTD